MKRFLSILLACMLLLGMTCLSAAASYDSPVAGENGLLIVPPEEYFDGELQRTSTGVYDDRSAYSYHYAAQGAEGQGSAGNNSTWSLMEAYKDALIFSGYYELVDYAKDQYEEQWVLGYIGPENLAHFRYGGGTPEIAAIRIRSLFGMIYVSYAKDIRTTNYDEVNPFAESPSGSSSSSFSSSGTLSPQQECVACHGHKKVQCTNCWGSGQVSSATMSTGRRTCRVCNGTGKVTCSRCGGTGKR